MKYNKMDYIMYYLGLLVIPFSFGMSGNLLQYEGGLPAAAVFAVMGFIMYGVTLQDKLTYKLFIKKQRRKKSDSFSINDSRNSIFFLICFSVFILHHSPFLFVGLLNFIFSCKINWDLIFRDKIRGLNWVLE